MTTREGRGAWPLVTAALVLAGLVYGFSAYPLLEPDEGRNAEIAREMAESNDYVIPRLNGLPYVDKPVLYFAAGAAVMEVLGPTALAARLPSLLFTVATLGLLAWFGRRMFGPAAGWTAAIATGAAPLTLAFARTVIFDSALTLWVLASLMSFYEAVERWDPANPGVARRWTTAAWGTLALGVLTKGPIALALPLMVAVPYALWRRRAAALLDAVALLLFVAVILPWVAAMARTVPGYLDYVLVTETFKRLTTDELRRTGPFWYFLPIIVAGSLPWSLVLLSRLRRALGTAARRGPADHRVVFLLLWIVVPLVFFSLSRSKRPHYVLPLIPAIGLLVAHAWHETRERLAGARPTAVVLGLVGVVLLLAPVIVPALLDVTDGVAATIAPTSTGLGTVTLVSSAALWAAAGHRGWTLLMMSAPVAAIPVVGLDLMGAVGRDRSAAAAAAAMEPLLQPGTEVVAVRHYPLSLPFYLRRPLTVATDDGAELTSNYLRRTLDHWRGAGSPLRPGDWWFDALVTCERPRMFVVGRDDDEARRLLGARTPVVAEHRKFVVYGPCSRSDLARAD